MNKTNIDNILSGLVGSIDQFKEYGTIMNETTSTDIFRECAVDMHRRLMRSANMENTVKVYDDTGLCVFLDRVAHSYTRTDGASVNAVFKVGKIPEFLRQQMFPRTDADHRQLFQFLSAQSNILAFEYIMAGNMFGRLYKVVDEARPDVISNEAINPVQVFIDAVVIRNTMFRFVIETPNAADKPIEVIKEPYSKFHDINVGLHERLVKELTKRRGEDPFVAVFKTFVTSYIENLNRIHNQLIDGFFRS